MTRTVERVCLVLAFGLLAAGLAFRSLRGLPPRGMDSALYVPAGLWVLALLNSRLRSKVLAWSIFTGALVVGMIIFGAWAVASRALPGGAGVDFWAATVLYACLAVAAAGQLRFRK